MALSPWLTRAEAASYLKVDENTIYRWAREGLLKEHRIGTGRGWPRYKTTDLDAMVRVAGELTG